jgi:hypothetical protein
VTEGTVTSQSESVMAVTTSHGCREKSHRPRRVTAKDISDEMYFKLFGSKSFKKISSRGFNLSQSLAPKTTCKPHLSVRFRPPFRQHHVLNVAAFYRDNQMACSRQGACRRKAGCCRQGPYLEKVVFIRFLREAFF